MMHSIILFFIYLSERRRDILIDICDVPFYTLSCSLVYEAVNKDGNQLPASLPRSLAIPPHREPSFPPRHGATTSHECGLEDQRAVG